MNLRISARQVHEAAKSLDHPYLTVGLERYNRVASSVAIEPRHPFLDQRLVAFCLTLPGSQKLGEGWPKIILRRAMGEHLPDTVRWRRGKEHLGWDFTRALIGKTQSTINAAIDTNNQYILPDINANYSLDALLSSADTKDIESMADIYDAACLNLWLEHSLETR